MGISILKIRDENGNVVSVPAIKGEPGDDYVLTESDKEEIADIVSAGAIGNIETVLDGIIAIQNALIGGDSV